MNQWTTVVHHDDVADDDYHFNEKKWKKIGVYNREMKKKKKLKNITTTNCVDPMRSSASVIYISS